MSHSNPTFSLTVTGGTVVPFGETKVMVKKYISGFKVTSSPLAMMSGTSNSQAHRADNSLPNTMETKLKGK
jgi:hypothetical protein